LSTADTFISTADWIENHLIFYLGQNFKPMSIQEQMQEALDLEKHGEIADAAQIYQKIFDRDRGNRPVIHRLLVIYRKLKEYRKELAVIDAATTAYQQHQKTVQEKWINDHPKAAGIGRSMLRQLEQAGDKASIFGADPTVDEWLRRMKFVKRKISGKKAKKPKSKKVANGAAEKRNPVIKRMIPKKGLTAIHGTQAKSANGTQAKPADRIQPKPANGTQAKPANGTQAKPAKIIPKKEAVLVRLPQKTTAPPPPLIPITHPSLFIISLTYLVPLEKIDAAMTRHVSYLDNHFKKGDFLVSGRKLPRTGGIIIARGADRKAIEKMVKEDPFIKGKLAVADIQEFSASKVGKELKLLK
jgi:uncharacterized protein YciI